MQSLRQQRRRIRGSAASVCALAWALVAGAIAAPGLQLSWDPNPEPDLAGYLLHYGLQSGSYTVTRDLGIATTAELDSLTAGSTYYFAVTAYDIEGMESLPSNEVSFTVPVVPPPVPPPPAPPPPTSLLTHSVPLAPGLGLGNLPPAGTATVIDSGLLADGSFQFFVKTMPGSRVTIYGSSDLESWIVLGEMVNSTGIMVVQDVEAIGLEQRFYRVESPAPTTELEPVPGERDRPRSMGGEAKKEA